MNNELIERIDEELERIRAEEDAFDSLEGSVMHIARDIERRKSLWNDCKAAITQQCGVTAMSNPCVAAIQYALEADDGLIFLRLWNEGEFDAIRNEWHDVPEAVFIGADPLHPETKKQQEAEPVACEVVGRAYHKSFGDGVRLELHIDAHQWPITEAIPIGTKLYFHPPEPATHHAMRGAEE